MDVFESDAGRCYGKSAQVAQGLRLAISEIECFPSRQAQFGELVLRMKRESINPSKGPTHAGNVLLQAAKERGAFLLLTFAGINTKAWRICNTEGLQVITSRGAQEYTFYILSFRTPTGSSNRVHRTICCRKKS